MGAWAMAGLAAWTKNEGLLFVLALFVAHLLVIAYLRDWRQALRRQGIMLIGLAPMLLLIVAFKWGVAPANDLLASLQPAAIIDRLTNPWRLWYVLQSFGERRYPRAKFVQDVSRGILNAEMQITADNIQMAFARMRKELPGQMAGVDAFLNQPA